MLELKPEDIIAYNADSDMDSTILFSLNKG